MKLIEYQNNTQRTCPDLGSRELNNAHMIYGMVSEVEELHTAMFKRDITNIGEEITDGMWYLTNYCRINSIDISNWEHNWKGSVKGDHTTNLTLHLSTLADFEKRELAYKKEFSKENKSTICWNIWYTYMQLYVDNVLSPSQCMDNNIDKLKRRYPDKFNVFDALNRNLDAERKELEK